MTAPSRAITQYVSILIFLIRIAGKKRIDKITNTNVEIEIMSVGIIPNQDYLPISYEIQLILKITI